MNTSQLLENLKSNPDILSLGEKLLGGLVVAALSMLVVFVVLIIIALVIQLMNKAPQDNKPQQDQGPLMRTQELQLEQEEVNLVDNKALVAVITAAISASSNNNIVVRRIVRTNNVQGTWERSN